jgi:hypothetical protein
VSGSLSDGRLSHGLPDRPAAAPAPATCTLRVQAVFQDVDELRAQALAAEMIARAHELANRPESECDVDVSVEYAASEAQR